MVWSGLDLLLSHRLRLVQGRRIGILCHAASVDRELGHVVDRLHAEGIDVRALFGPEHGIAGAAQDMVSVEVSDDASAEIPVYSLYGTTVQSLSPRREWLDTIDLLVVDLQDIGTRYYTYVWTMLLAMRACAERNIDLLILDRPNPLGGTVIEGPPIEAGFESFVGLHSIPVRHGMTCGELALLFRSELQINVAIEVIRLEGWARSMSFEETGLPWILPSPNMPTVDTAYVYAGMCLCEGTNLSEGRGTTRPFEIIGAPWIDGSQLAAAAHAVDLPGVRCRPLRFVPTFHKHAGQTCGGIQLHVVDRRAFRPFHTGLTLLALMRRLWPREFAWRRDAYEFVCDRLAIDLLVGGSWFRDGLDTSPEARDPGWGWGDHERDFAERRRPYLLY